MMYVICGKCGSWTTDPFRTYHGELICQKCKEDIAKEYREHINSMEKAKEFLEKNGYVVTKKKTIEYKTIEEWDKER